MNTQKVRLLISRETAFLLENQNLVNEYKSDTKPEVLINTVDNDLAYLAALCQNLRYSLGTHPSVRPQHDDVNTECPKSGNSAAGCLCLRADLVRARAEAIAEGAC